MQADLISRHARDRSDRDFTSSLIRETSGLSAYARKLTGSGVDAGLKASRSRAVPSMAPAAP